MQRFQRPFASVIAAAALLGTAAFSAHAQPQTAAAAPAAQTAPAHAHKVQKMDLAQRHAQHMEHLKTVLQIQPSQQAAWDQYVKAITPEPRAKADRQQRPDLRKLTTPERLDLAQKLRKERNAKAEQREQATRSFYASLNPSQQKAFDAISAQHHGKPGMHKAGHGKRFDEHRGPRHHGHAPVAAPAGAPAPAVQ